MTRTDGDISLFLFKGLYRRAGSVFVAVFLLIGCRATNLPISVTESTSFAKEAVYRIGPEDSLRISVWKNRDLSLDNVFVRPDGKISIPLVQDIQAEGLTATELAALIRQKLLAYVKDPQVSVIVTGINASKIYVIGNVARPGSYPLRQDLSVLQALSLAGGFTPFASPKKIKLIRKEGNKQEVYTVNYHQIIDLEGKGNLLLKPGDTILVP